MIDYARMYTLIMFIMMMYVIWYSFCQVFLYVVGSFCSGGTCDSTSSAAQVNAGLQLTFACCGALAVMG